MTLHFTTSQASYRGRDDTTALNTDGGYKAAINTPWSQDVDTTFRVRFGLQETGAASGSFVPQLQYQRNATGYVNVTGTSNVVRVAGGLPTDGDATSTALLGGTGTYAAGAYDEVDGLTGTHAVAASGRTEVEFAVQIRSVDVVNGDTVELRCLGKSNATTALDVYAQTPTITVVEPTPVTVAGVVASATADAPISVVDTGPELGLINRTWIEGGHHLGPFKDPNGTLYIFTERTELTGAFELIKSSDGGDTWTVPDSANQPVTPIDDIEALDARLVGDTLHWVMQSDPADTVRYHTYRTSVHATNPDTFNISQEVTASADPLEQNCSIEVRGDGTVVAAYTRFQTTAGTNDHAAYKIRSTGGTWGTETVINSGDGNLYHQITSVQDANGLVHFFYNNATTGTVFTRTLSTSDVLEATERTVTTGVGTATVDRQPILPPLAHTSGGDQIVTVAYKRTSDDVICLRTITNAGTPSAEVVVSDNAVAHNIGGTPGMNNRQPVATLVRDPSTGELHLFYANAGASAVAVDPTRTLYHAETTSGTWGTDTAFRTNIDSHAMRAEVFTHSAGNGGARVVGLYWDTGSQGAEGSRYDEYVLPAAGPTIAGVAASATADAPTPVVTSADTVIVQAIAADASADAPLPTVTADIAVSAVAADASADAPTPAVAAGGAVTITAVVASASADAPAPVVSAGGAPPVRTRRLVIHLSPVA